MNAGPTSMSNLSSLHKAVCLPGAGVTLKSGEEVTADFVVDASGRSSQLPQWLDAIGVTPPQAQCISAGLGYGSRTYAMPENWFQQKVTADFWPLLLRDHDFA